MIPNENESVRLSLCMIVRDNEDHIEECLTSIKPWVDEMIVVDTGSTDATAEISKRLGAKVFHCAWEDSFSRARNESLRHASGEWIFWMDSDDVIDVENGRQIRALADRKHPESTMGFVMQVHCPGENGIESGDVTVVDHIKIFRNQDKLRFEGRIHEQILPAIRRASGEVAWTDIHVCHVHGSVSERARAQKHERDLRLLHLELEEQNGHTFVLFNLGMTYADMEEWEKATEYLLQSIEVALPQESHVRRAYDLLIACLSNQGFVDEAAKICEQALEVFADDLPIIFRKAGLTHQSGDLLGAIAQYRKLLLMAEDLSTERTFSSHDIGVTGHKARHNLAVVLSELNRWDHAEYHWRLALDEAPGFSAAKLGLKESLIRQGKTGALSA